MKIFKIVLTVILSALLVASIVLNIILFKSSYASLLIRYDKDMFYSLADNATKSLYPTSFLQSKNNGVEFFIDFDDSNNSTIYYFYVDEESKLSFKIKETINNKSITYYLSNNTLYVYDEANNSKVKYSSTINDEYYNVAISTTKIDKLLPFIQSHSKEKTESDFNSSYILGIEYEAEINDNTSYTYYFDLNGILRSVEVETENKEYTVTIKQNNTKIEMPDFSDYTEK